MEAILNISHIWQQNPWKETNLEIVVKSLFFIFGRQLWSSNEPAHRGEEAQKQFLQNEGQTLIRCIRLCMPVSPVLLFGCRSLVAEE